MGGRMGRVEPGFEGAFGGEAAGFGGDPADRLGCRVDRVDPLAGFAGVPGFATHRDAQVELALVGQNRLQAGRLAHHAQRGLAA